MYAANILREKGGEIYSVGLHDPIVMASKTLAEKRVGAAVVRDADGLPCGVFSERDLVRAVGQLGVKALDCKVKDLMSPRLITATPSHTIDQLMTIMTDRRIRHVIIQDGANFIGVISIGDVVKLKIAVAEAETESLKSYIEMV